MQARLAMGALECLQSGDVRTTGQAGPLRIGKIIVSLLVFTKGDEF